MMCPWCQCMDGTPWGQKLLCNLNTHVCSVLFPQLHVDLLTERWSRALLPNATRRRETNEREAAAQALMGLTVLASGRATENERLTTARVIEKMTSHTNTAQYSATQSRTCTMLAANYSDYCHLLIAVDPLSPSIHPSFLSSHLWRGIKMRRPF